MSSAYTYQVTNQAGQVVSSGSVQLNAGASQTITLQGQAGQSYTLSVSNGGTVVATISATCQQGPSFTSSGTCNNGTVSFVVANNGGAMGSAYTYQITNSSGQVVNSGNIQLGANQSQTISIPGQAGQVYTLRVSNGQVVVVTMTATCAQPPPPPTTVPPTATPIPPTPTRPAVVCGSVTIDANGFPVLNTAGCNEDTSKPPRAKWTPITPAPAVCEDWLVYHTNKSAANTWDVYRLGNIPGKGETPVNLTQGPRGTYSIAPALSPDRRNIAFYSNRDGNWEVYVSATDGLSAPQRVSYNTFAVDQDPVWSPDGRYVLYESSRRGNFDLILVDVTIGPDSETALATGPANEVNAYFSPDGKFVVYESLSQGTSQIFTYELSTQKTTKISDGTGADFNPTFSPDGKQIAFRTYRNNGAVGVLTIANADGKNAKAISDPSRTATNHAWSPDGKYIAWQSDLGGVMSVYVADVATGQTRQATDKVMAGNKNAINYAPSWYCKGPTLIFTSDVTGSSNVFTIPALPLTAAPVKVDTAATNLTNGKGTEKNQYAENSPSEEDASRLGLAPTTPVRR
jgi:Tol biopolymer transport system component